MAKDRIEEILDSLLNDIGIEVDEFIAQVHKREPVKASSDELHPQKNDTPSPIPKLPKSGDAPALPSGTKATQPEFDSEDLKKTFAPKPETPEYGFGRASSPSGMSGGVSPVQQSRSGYDPNSKLPWFKHGMKGFFRKLWHGDHPENPSWQGYKAEQRLTLDECIFLNKQISEKVDQLSNQFLTEAVVTDYDDLINSLKEKIASHFRQAVAEARQKGSNSRGAGRKTNLETLNVFLSQLGIDPLTNLDEAMETLINKINTDEIDMEGWEFVKNKNTWILKKGTRTLPPFGNQGKGIIQRLINKKKSPEADSAEMSSSSAPTADDVDAGKGDDTPTGVVSKVRPISPPSGGDESGKEGDNADVSSKTANVFTNEKSKEFIGLMPHVLGDSDPLIDIYSLRSWKKNIANSEDEELKSFYTKRLKQHNDETKESKKLEELKKDQQLKLHIQVMADLISKHGFSGELSPEEILKMDKSQVENKLREIPVDREPVELSQGPSKGAVSSYKFEGAGLDHYKATKILEQLNPHHKLEYYKKLLSCGIRMSSDRINLSEIKLKERVKYLKEKLYR